ncbi:NADH-quinone oxidoreductase subunit NuoH [Pyrobaculum neutrophilum]|uniref:NADH dehydrogenase (Quinone) n=1 Tax=Pyrobaculum neutrophilum (strain DSM 2338 / JCM 9278 / NBRC 100436 / V24Sta) TaxID=444157 RepID=B1YB11_PYRNV|nr:NADH-quinone oxidoreductase subunit NuoH [Pyrobaculum neutrophilum]ACB40711.1 NADH dehydrogenase (quinone) [Pyrobaculum neutrophilum V24Sta]
MSIPMDILAAVVFPGVLGVFGFLVVAIWLERKLVARIQWRYGPLYVSKSVGGFLQPIADLVKLVFSELVLPAHTNRLLFAATPIFLFFAEAVPLIFIAPAPGLVIAYQPYGLAIALVLVLLVAVLVVTMAWTEADKFTYIGAVREILLTAAYEVPLLLAALAMFILYKSADPYGVVEAQSGLWGVLLNPLAFAVYLVALLMSTTRLPFEIPEAEPEVVLGPYTEYGSTLFIYAFGANYVKLYTLSLLGAVLFLGGWAPAAGLLGAAVTATKMAVFVLPALLVRAVYPRYRIDQALRLGWGKLLALSAAAVAWSIAVDLLW